MPKGLFCTNINAVMQILFELQYKARLHVFVYTIITYGWFNIQSLDKDHSTQHEMTIPIIYGLATKNGKANCRKIVIYYLKTCKQLPFLNIHEQKVIEDESIRIQE